jgi:small-conductance mechanosensitive channel
MTQLPTMPQWFISAGVLAVGLCLGLILEKLFLARVERLAERTRWKGDDVIVASVKGYLLPGSILAALVVIFRFLPLSAPVARWSERIFFILTVVLCTLILARFAMRSARFIGRETAEHLPSTSILQNLCRVVVYIIGILIILQSFGISIAPLLTALGVGGLAVALALQDTLSNFFAGLNILLSKKIKPGDYIKLDGGYEGYVTDISWRETTVRALRNNVIVIPNSKVASALITNYTLTDKEVTVAVEVGVGYDSDLNTVESVTIEVARGVMCEVKGGVPDFEPILRYNTFGDSSIQFAVNLRVMEFSDQFLVKHEFIKRLITRYRREGITIPFPIRTVQLLSIQK